MTNQALLAFVLRLVPKRLSEDAAQEAALAMLEGRDPIAVVDKFRKAALRRERREVSFSDLGGEHLIHDEGRR